MVGDKDAEDNWRQLALEAMVTLCETAPAMVRKQVPNGVSMLTPLVLEMMCELDDEPDWSMQDDAAEDDNEQSVFSITYTVSNYLAKQTPNPWNLKS